MGRRGPRRLLVTLAATAMLTAACTDSGGSTESTDDGSSAPTGGTFSTALGSDPEALAPTSQCYSSDCSQVLSTIYEGLLTIDPETNEQILGTAESIESPDGKVWTIKLKPDQKFHNGEPVDAASYIRAWNYTAYGPNATQVGFFFESVEGYDDLQGENPKAEELSGVKAVDDLTIEITLSEAFSQWPLLMSYTPAFAPVAKECMEDLAACNEEPIGNGAYQMSEPWKHSQYINVEKWDGYTGDAPANADAIEMKMYSDLKTAFRDWQAGNLDITSGTDPSQVVQAQQLAGDRFLSVDNGSFTAMGLPYYVADFDDVRIRQALSMAIDRDAIAERILNGIVSPASDVIAPFVTGSRDDACEYCVYDPEAAKALYDEAGGIPGNRVEIWFNNDGGHEAWTQAIAEGWKNTFGLDYEFKSQPFTPYLKALDEGTTTGPFRTSWIPDYPSPENYLTPLYGPDSPSNYTQYESDEFVQLIEEADGAPSIEDGIPLYQQAADVVLADMPVIPLWYGKTSIVYSENVENVIYDPLQQRLLGEVTVVS